MKRMKLRNTVRKQITTLAGIRRKLLIGKASKGQRNLIRLTKFSICFLKYGFLKYMHRFKLMKLTETLITFASVKLQSNYFNQSHCATSSHPGPQVLLFLFRSFYLGFHKYSRITGVQGKGMGISSTLPYHFHPLCRHLDICRTNPAGLSPLQIASSRTRTRTLWFPSASR